MTERGPVAFHFSSLARNVAAGTRLALFLPVRAHHFRASALDFALLSLFSFVLWVAAAAARLGFDGEFDPTAVPGYMAGIVLVLAAAMLIALAFRAPSQLLLIAVALSASQPVFHVVALVLILAGLPAWSAVPMFYAFLGWIWLVSLRAVAITAGTQRPQFLQAALAVTAMIAIDFSVLPDVDPWIQPEDEESETTPLADERLFHLQGELIERHLAAIKPGRQGTPELYFVGFAPDASQDVFVKEMRFVRNLFDERFGTAGHSIALASSHDALEEFPIATVTNLGRALRRVGESMNTDEDVLFLFITAHGNRLHRLSANQPPLELTALTPTALSRLLQESGVKWRVIVVSACYSGGYIEPLRDANTIVITAAAPDRTSFGCEAGRDFTYFGQAFFRDALARTRSFVSAFDMAKDIVTKQETSEKLTPSLPQIWVGPGIAERLKAFEP
jgi:hypothetical protein